jgi:hypothetical protein
MKIQLTLSAEQLTIIAETLCYYRVHTRLDEEPSAKCYNDPVWKEHFNNLQKNVAVRILTYSDLIDKMENTIQNLKNML